MSVEIKYNGSTIANLESGQTATLPCSGKKMVSDLEVIASQAADSPLPIEVATEDTMNALLETAEVGAVYKYTGTTTDTYESGALYVVEKALISFTAEGVTYQAEEGMTWGEWIDSDYNTEGFGVSANEILAPNGYYVWENYNHSGSPNKVVVGDTIVENYDYMVSQNNPAN